MLDYEWGTDPSPIIPSGEEPEPEPEPDSEPAFVSDPAHHMPTYGSLLAPLPPATAPFSHQFGPQYGGGFYEHHPQSYPIPTYDPVGGGGGGEFLVVAKREEGVPAAELAARIGLNLGGRTYFSSEEEEFVNRLYRRSRSGLGEPGSGSWARCQAEGCNADLSQAKHYHRRHKVCEFHSKASTVITAGLTQRFCQQCSRFHVLAEFDNGKRSCRKRLADHNRRRRKTQQSNQGSPKSQPFETTSSTDAAAGSTMDSTSQSSWSVTVAVSPPQMSLDCLNQRSYSTTY